MVDKYHFSVLSINFITFLQNNRKFHQTKIKLSSWISFGLHKIKNLFKLKKSLDHFELVLGFFVREVLEHRVLKVQFVIKLL